MSTLEQISEIPIIDKWKGKPCMVHTTAVKSFFNTHQAPAVEKYHTQELKWDHIGYVFMIEMDGSIYFSRPTADKQYHCAGGGQNRESLGIAIAGNGVIQFATMEQMLSLERIINAYGFTEIRYHCDYSKKSCPGIKLMKTLENYTFTANLIKRNGQG
ncbi:MAG: peptidoglycan recognition protein family protein [Cetobacterium sp.]